MAEGDLGVAQLRITADTSQAIASLRVLRTEVARGFGDVAPLLFRGLTREAFSVGTQVGSELSRSISLSLNAIDVGALRRQLDFSDILRGSISSIRDFQTAFSTISRNSQIFGSDLQQGTLQANQLALGLRAVGSTTAGANALSAAFASVRSNIQESLAGLRLLNPQLQNLLARPAQGIQLVPARAPQPAPAALPSQPASAATPVVQTVQAQVQLTEREAQAVGFLQRQLERLRNTRLTLDASNLRNLGDEARQTSNEILEFTRNIINGTKATASSIDGLRQQARAFSTLAQKVKLGSIEFVNFTQAAAKAQQRETLTGGFEQIDALRRLYAQPQAGIIDSFRGTERLLRFGQNLGATPADIRLYISALEEARSVTDTADKNFGRLTDEITRQRQALEQATLSTLDFVRARQQLNEQGVSRREAKIQGIQDYYADKNPRAGGVRDENGAILARGKGDLAAEAAYRQSVAQAEEEQRINAELERQNLQHKQAYEQIRAQRIERQQQLALERERVNQRERAAAEFRASPVSGLLADGSAIPGSPAGNARIDALIRQRLQDAAAASEQLRLQSIRAAEYNANRGVGASPISGLMSDGFAAPGSPAGLAWTQEQIRLAREREIQRGRQIGLLNAVDINGRLPSGGFAPGSPRALEQAAKRRKDALGSALIGGAFPLLFGQGAFASIGGGAGGALGGLVGGQFGFGLSLIGTAVGAQIDALSKRFTDLSAALQDPIKNIDTLTQQFILASKAQEDYVKALIESGQTAKATEVITQQTARSLDPATAAAVASTTDSFNRNLATTQNLLGTIVSGPGAGFLAFLNSILGVASGVGGSTTTLTAGTEGQALFKQRKQEQTGNLLFNVLNPISALTAPQRTTNLQRQSRVAFSSNVEQSETRLTGAQKEQQRVQDAITRAREQGNASLAKALERTNKLNEATTAYRKREVEISQSLALKDINAAQAAEQQTQNRQTLKLKYDEANASALDARRISAQQLADDRRRVELQSRVVALTGAESYAARAQLITANAQAKQLELRLQQEQAGRDVSIARQAFNKANENPTNAAAIKAAAADLATATNNYNATRLKTDLESSKIQKDTQIQLRDLQRQRFAEELAQANQIKAIRLQQRIEATRPNLSPLGNQSLANASKLIQAQSDYTEAQRNLANAPDDPSRIRNFATAAEGLKLAGITFRNNIVEAFDNAQKQVRELQRGVGEAIVSLAEQQSGSGGVNGFLRQAYGPGVDKQRQVDSFNTLLPIFQSRRAQFAEQERSQGRYGIANAVDNLNFRGSYEGVNKAMIEFIRSVDNEATGREQIVQTQKDLTKAIAGNDVTAQLLNTKLTDLAEVIYKLTTKDWNVYVSNNGSNPPVPSPTPVPPTPRTPQFFNPQSMPDYYGPKP